MAKGNKKSSSEATTTKTEKTMAYKKSQRQVQAARDRERDISAVGWKPRKDTPDSARCANAKCRHPQAAIRQGKATHCPSCRGNGSGARKGDTLHYNRPPMPPSPLAEAIKTAGIIS